MRRACRTSATGVPHLGPAPIASPKNLSERGPAAGIQVHCAAKQNRKRLIQGDLDEQAGVRSLD
jgi:hypothetical protein